MPGYHAGPQYIDDAERVPEHPAEHVQLPVPVAVDLALELEGSVVQPVPPTNRVVVAEREPVLLAHNVARAEHHAHAGAEHVDDALGEPELLAHCVDHAHRQPHGRSLDQHEPERES